MPDSPHDERSARLLAVVVSIAFVIATIGFVTGTRPSRYQAASPPTTVVEQAGTVPLARSHAELQSHPWGRDPGTSSFPVSAQSMNLRTDTLDRSVLEKGRASGKLTRSAVALRAARRAFDGAPPTIPHPVRQGSASECLACHAEGRHIGAAVANELPHPAFASCTQCHVVSAAPFATHFAETEANDAKQARNVFTGALPGAGQRAYVGAPPTVPHSTWMREACKSCHGADGPMGLHTRHPERQSCSQCHAPNALLDQFPRLLAKSPVNG